MAVKYMLIPDWRRAWRFSSVRLVAFGGLCQLTVMLTPDKVAQHAPDWVMQGLSVAAMASTFLAALGRITRIEKRHDLEPPPAPGGH